MSLNNLQFIACFVFLFVVMFLLQIIRNKSGETIFGKIQLIILLIFSYFFICYADYRFAISIAISTLITHFAGVLIEKVEEQKTKKAILTCGIAISLLLLAYFKYTNFFINSFCHLFRLDSVTLNIILPLGISFYTFTAISYMIDVYNEKYPPEYNIMNTALFIVFFPKITDGPIIRGSEFLPQVKEYKGLTVENFETGIQIFVFGLFKKMVLADHLSVFVDDTFFAPSAFTAGTVILGAVSYSLQIYLDFSGYSDMAIGAAKILGFDFSKNFNLPYMAENISDFWKRWHISLSSWFQDYLYIPLGGGRKGNIRTYINLMLVMLVSGLWHGAGYTFIVWGAFHGLASCINRLLKKSKWMISNITVIKLLRILGTFIIVTILWVIFRADSLSNAVDMFKSITNQKGISQPYTWTFFALVCLIGATIAAMLRTKKNGENVVNGYYPIMKLNKIWTLTLFFIFVGITIIMGYYGNTAFIYGKF